jgi:hypothetical protein
MRAKRSRQEWAALLTELKVSGEPLAAFCARRQIKVASLKWWRWHLRNEGRSARSTVRAGVRLLQVDVAGLAARPASKVILSILGVKLRVEVGTDVAYVGALVSELRSRC